MSESENASTIPGADKLVSYRDWLGALSRAGRGIVFVALFVLFLLVGWSVDPLQATIGTRPAQLLLWIIVIFMVYTLYGIVRPLVT